MPGTFNGHLVPETCKMSSPLERVTGTFQERPIKTWMGLTVIVLMKNKSRVSRQTYIFFDSFPDSFHRNEFLGAPFSRSELLIT